MGSDGGVDEEKYLVSERNGRNGDDSRFVDCSGFPILSFQISTSSCLLRRRNTKIAEEGRESD